MREIILLADGDMENLAMELQRHRAYHPEMMELALAIRDCSNDAVFAVQSAKEKELEQELSVALAKIEELEEKVGLLRTEANVMQDEIDSVEGALHGEQTNE